MADLRPRGEAGGGGGPGVGEEVQHLDGPPRSPDHALGPVPVRGLLREDAGVLEAHGLHPEAELPVPDDPARRQAVFLPRPAAGRAAPVGGVRPVPPGIGAGGVPDGLGVRAQEELVAPALQLLAPGGVQKLIVFPAITDPHKNPQDDSRMIKYHDIIPC